MGVYTRQQTSVNFDDDYDNKDEDYNKDDDDAEDDGGKKLR